MRKTKIVATLGPSSFDRGTISDMIDAGMNVVRLNFSHGTHESHGAIIDIVRELAEEKGICVSILQDLCGPKIRLGELPEEGIKLNPGDTCVLASENFASEGVIPVQYEHLAKDLSVGDRILLADGAMDLMVEDLKGHNATCRVLNGGTAFSKKGVNMPCSSLSVVAFTEKDRKDLEFGLKKGVDIVALSFVRSAADLVKISDMIKRDKNKPMLIAKIEKPQAVQNIDEILEMVDGVMVARGDLGVEMSLYEVPVIQKQIIRAARKEGKIVITATQMLKSMVSNYRPTRAECTDVANAIFDGTCAVMLSEETASGEYPLESVNVMNRIALATEENIQYNLDIASSEHVSDKTVAWAVGRSASWLAKDLGAKAIVAYTNSGFTARSVARFRPECPILGLTSKLGTYRKLNISWGVIPGLSEAFEEAEEMFSSAAEMAVAKGFAGKGDRIVITSGIPLGSEGSTNLIRVYEI
ncbi:pyruvate kinase [Denitrovibrio acetiphilus DSM 12809]|uniref:Pyruvate kinase n=1 Tax=Denitrovibrio acetiphilus (strain DSM 12809 / NBRC 114555 / N2460) TaxID=522772 RepID=D4H6W7_DENA2|nr:pyruvate kinase [Denitrovibrio acetiphilus]ADD67833.1 pyruvate kinase [Denitrovibrio acetiphilus DSM 12809]